MADLQSFCETLDLDATSVAEALRKERRDSAAAVDMPWYARLVVGFGAWISALVAIVLGGTILAFLGAENEFSVVVMGTVYFLPGLLWLREDRQHVFGEQLGIAITAAGMAMIVAGVGFLSEEAWVATVASLFLTVVIVRTLHYRSLQFLAALFTACVFVGTLISEEMPYYLDILALAGPAAAFLMLRPSRHDLQPTATVLLITMPILGVFYDVGQPFWEVGTAGGWVARMLYAAVFLWLASIHWRRLPEDSVHYRLSIFVVAAAVVGILLPPGGSASLVIIMLAFIVGSRPLAVLGVLLQVFYIWRFYYDMELTLLQKSGVMLAVGVVLIAAWWLMQRRMAEEERA